MRYEVCTRRDGKDLTVAEMHVTNGFAETALPSIGKADDWNITVFKSLRGARRWLAQRGYERFTRINYAGTFLVRSAA